MEYTTASNTFLYIRFYGIKVPENTKKSDKFIIRTKDSAGNTICIN